MSTLILGAGNVGFQLAKQLIEANQDVVLIEKDEKRASLVSEMLDCRVINARGTSVDVLKEAGAQKAENFIAVTDSDEVNLVACGTIAGNFGIARKVARVRNIDYFGPDGIHRPLLGIDYIVNPEVEVSKAIINAIERGAVSEVMFFEKTGLQMRSIKAAANSIFNGKSIEEISDQLQISFLVAVILRDNDYIIPNGDLKILENDKLHLIATDENFKRIFEKIGKNAAPLNRITVVGGNRVGQYVVEELLDPHKKRSHLFGRFLRPIRKVAGKSVYIIDNDYERCKYLSEHFPGALVLYSDFSDENFSEEERLAKSDLVVTNTDNQDLNIVSAVYAKSLGAKRTIALVNKSNYLHIGADLGIDVTVSPIQSMVATILRHISSQHIRSVHNISGGYLDVIEVSVGAGGKFTEKKIRDIKLPPHSLIISVTRNDTNFVPDGDLVLRNRDFLLIIARRESVPKLQEVFSV